MTQHDTWTDNEPPINSAVANTESQLYRQLLRQRTTTLEKIDEAVHNGPLQELAVLLRADAELALTEPLRSHLTKISNDLRGIFQTMRLEMQDEAL